MNTYIHKIRTIVTSKRRMVMEIEKGYDGIFWSNGNVLYLNKSWSYTDVCICQNPPNNILMICAKFIQILP